MKGRSGTYQNANRPFSGEWTLKRWRECEAACYCKSKLRERMSIQKKKKTQMHLSIHRIQDYNFVCRFHGATHILQTIPFFPTIGPLTHTYDYSKPKLECKRKRRPDKISSAVTTEKNPNPPNNQNSYASIQEIHRWKVWGFYHKIWL